MATLEPDAAKAAFSDDVVSAACKEAQQLLKEHYYKDWDCQQRMEAGTDEAGNGIVRAKLAALYHPEASIVWQGRVVQQSELHQYVSEMPPTKHEIHSLDVQPFQDANHSLVSVHGTCGYGDFVARGFQQQFVIWKDTTSGVARFWILQDCLRWLGEEEIS